MITKKATSCGAIEKARSHRRGDHIADEWIFKIPQKPSVAFVTDRFVELVHKTQLTGFAFEQLWQSEDVPAPMSSKPKQR